MDDITPRPARRIQPTSRPTVHVRPALRRPEPVRPTSHMDLMAQPRPVAKPPTPPVQPQKPEPKLEQKPVEKKSLLAVVRPKTPRPVAARQPAEKRPRRRAVVIYSMATVLFLAGLGVVVQGILVNKQAADQTKAISSTSSSVAGESVSVPSEKKPPGDYVKSYQVAPTLPRIIRISKIGVEARVLQVGTDNNNQMQTPYNIYDTAWYTGSSLPGDAGAMVVNGHYSGPLTHGVFSKLDRLGSGDTIQIERGDGTVLEYVVQSTETIPVEKVNMSKLLVSVDTARPGLNLITCGGEYNASSYQFSDRTIVYALQK